MEGKQAKSKDVFLPYVGSQQHVWPQFRVSFLTSNDPCAPLLSSLLTSEKGERGEGPYSLVSSTQEPSGFRLYLSLRLFPAVAVSPQVPPVYSEWRVKDWACGLCSLSAPRRQERDGSLYLHFTILLPGALESGPL